MQLFLLIEIYQVKAWLHTEFAEEYSLQNVCDTEINQFCVVQQLAHIAFEGNVQFKLTIDGSQV